MSHTICIHVSWRAMVMPMAMMMVMTMATMLVVVVVITASSSGQHLPGMIRYRLLLDFSSGFW